MSAYNFEELQMHVGHDVKVVEYSKEGIIYNVAVECETCNDVLIEYENPVITKLFAPWLKGTFTINGENAFIGYFNPGHLWNGWFAPAFEKDELLRWLNIEMPNQYTFIEKIDAILVDLKGADPDYQYIISINAETSDGPKHLYVPEGWYWKMADSDDDLCYCGHTRGAHFLDGGKCSQSDCNCQKFLESDD